MKNNLQDIFLKLVSKGYEVHNKRLLGNPKYTSEETKLKDVTQEIALVIEWLRVNHGIEVVVIPDSSSQSQLLLRKYTYSIFTPVNGSNLHCQIGRDENKNIVYFLKPQKAYLAAFDYIKNNNLI